MAILVPKALNGETTTVHAADKVGKDDGGGDGCCRNEYGVRFSIRFLSGGGARPAKARAGLLPAGGRFLHCSTTYSKVLGQKFPYTQVQLPMMPSLNLLDPHNHNLESLSSWHTSLYTNKASMEFSARKNHYFMQSRVTKQIFL